MDEVLQACGAWLAANVGRIVWLVVVLAVACVVVRVVAKGLRAALDRSEIPSASIFVNIARVIIWCLALALVLQPVFGINPSTIVTALGVGGVALSLGLKDTIANVIGGFQLMLGKVIQPGDLVSIAGTTGVVKDITWRQTVVEERGGNEMVIPNSQLNTAQLERLTPGSEGCAKVPFTARPGSDPDQVTEAIVAAVAPAVADLQAEGAEPVVRFTGATAFGLAGEIVLTAKPGLFLGVIQDRATRAIAGADWLAEMPH
ncbi:mechanosensitive ion channel [Bifidobacterium pullorum subsp. saeculare]|uniref:Mechanosensitive ion channel n=1 Tax=Bifidobacterium pullorum subsp. saeculare TaxID=78257 RepID=A0A939BA99_9BIFI|nr:mechanosensitive ion channel domain-containing protein [Bifidobacterium pullorum]MBM6700368.1 mechanosensitive ion channel [Bifidobacterium pullorum subsp. saeculare]